MSSNDEGGIGSLIIIGLIIWGLVSFFGDKKEEASYESDLYQGTSYSSSYDCPEPENPYSYDTGHYAGFAWGESHGYCEYGNSNSFYEGCLDWESQNSDYELCQEQN